MLLLQVPDVIIATLFVVASVGLSLAGLLLFHHFVSDDFIARNRAAAADNFTMVSLLYAIIVGSLVASGWLRFGEAEQNATREANVAGTLIRFADGMPEPTRTELIDALVDYSRVVVEVEWPQMGRGEEIALENEPFERLWAVALPFEPREPREETLHAGIVEYLGLLDEERRLRVVNAQASLSIPLWILFLVGGGVSIFYTYLFSDARNSRFQALLVALLSGLFGFVLYLLFALQFPYSGDLSVPPEAFRDLVVEWSAR